MSTKYRVFAIDIDGTFFGTRLVEENLRVVEDLVASGHFVVPCTGRAARECAEVIARIDLVPVAVVADGAQVWDAVKSEAIVTRNVSVEALTVLHDTLDPLQTPIMLLKDGHVEGYDYALVCNDADWADVPRFFPWLEFRGLKTKRLDAFSPSEHTGVIRVDILARDVEQLTPVVQRLAERARELMEITPPSSYGSGPYSIRVHERGVNKWTGLSTLADMRGWHASEIVAIGNDQNDLPLFEEVGCSIAVADAAEAVCARARYITPSADEGGIAFAIEQVLTGKWK